MEATSVLPTRSDAPRPRFVDLFDWCDKEGRVSKDKATRHVLDEHRNVTHVHFAKRVRDKGGGELPSEQQVLVAVKQSWETDRALRPSLDRLLTELGVLRRLEAHGRVVRVAPHPHILRLVEHVQEPAVKHSAPVMLHSLVLEYAAGRDVLTWLQAAVIEGERGRRAGRAGASSAPAYAHLSLPLLRSVARQALDALAFLHAAGVYHCDVKLDNLFVQEPLVASSVDLLPLRTPASASVGGGDGGSWRAEVWVRPVHAWRRFGLDDNVIFADAPVYPRKVGGTKVAAPRPPSSGNLSASVSTQSNASSGSDKTSGSSLSVESGGSTTRGMRVRVKRADGTNGECPHILLADFDNSVVVSGPGARSWHVAGTPLFQAPEMAAAAAGGPAGPWPGSRGDAARTRASAGYDEAVDVWSLGMALLVGYVSGVQLESLDKGRAVVGYDTAGGLYEELQVEGLTARQLAKQHAACIARGRPGGMDPGLAALLQCMLTLAPADRITAADALAHPFFTHVALVALPSQEAEQAAPLEATRSGGGGGRWGRLASSVRAMGSLRRRMVGRPTEAAVTAGAEGRAEQTPLHTPAVQRRGAVRHLEDEYEVLPLVSGAGEEKQPSAFSVLLQARRASPPTCEGSIYSLAPGTPVIVKWYNLKRGGTWGVGETPFMDLAEWDVRRCCADGAPLTHPHIITVHGLYNQLYKPPGFTGEPVPSALAVMQPAHGGALDTWLRRAAVDAFHAWADAYTDVALRDAMDEAEEGHTLPVLAQIVAGPFLAAHLLRQLLLAVRYLHTQGRVHGDVRMYALMLLHSGCLTVGVPTFDYSADDLRAQLQVRVLVELPALPWARLPHLVLSPINPVLAGDSYKFRPAVLARDPELAASPAVDLWAAGDLLEVLLQGIAIKTASADPLHRRSRDVHLPPASFPPGAREVLAALRGYDPRTHGSSPDFIKGLLTRKFFARHRHVLRVWQRVRAYATHAVALLVAVLSVCLAAFVAARQEQHSDSYAVKQ